MTLLSKASIIASPTAYGDGVLNSVKPTDGAGDFDFARASSATRVNEEGLIEKERENLILQSNSFDTTWISLNTTETGGQSGYDGSSDAWLITKSASAARIYQTISVSGVQTYSVYAKSGTLNWVAVSNNLVYTYFNLSAGTIGTNVGTIDANIEDVGSGWYRCSITYNGSATDARIYPSQGDNDSSGTSGTIYIQDAQLEQGLVATDYIETTTSSVAVGITNDIPRINYENGIGNFLLEPQRSNLFIHSEYLEHSSWTKNNVTTTSNAAISPEGLQNASEVVGTTTSNFTRAIVSVPSGSLVMSAWIKSNDGTNRDFQMGAGSLGASGISTFTATSEWQRFEKVISIATAINTDFGFFNSAGNQLNLYIYGAQLEDGYLTSYIPTYGSAVTRLAETCNNAGNSDTFNDSEGVLYAEIAALSNLSNVGDRVIAISDGTATNRIIIYFDNTSNRLVYLVNAGGSSQFQGQTTLENSADYNKICLKYKVNDFALWVNGFEIATDNIGTTFGSNVLNRLAFDNGLGSADFYGKTKMVSTFTEALSDSELECLTSWSSFNRMATAQNYTIE